MPWILLSMPCMPHFRSLPCWACCATWQHMLAPARRILRMTWSCLPRCTWSGQPAPELSWHYLTKSSSTLPGGSLCSTSNYVPYHHTRSPLAPAYFLPHNACPWKLVGGCLWCSRICCARLLGKSTAVLRVLCCAVLCGAMPPLPCHAHGMLVSAAQCGFN